MSDCNNKPLETVDDIPPDALRALGDQFFDHWREFNAESNLASKDFAQYLFLVHGGGAVALLGFIQSSIASSALQIVAMITLAFFLLGLIATGFLLFARALATAVATIEMDRRRRLLRVPGTKISVVTEAVAPNRHQGQMVFAMKLSYAFAIIGLLVGFFGPAFSLLWRS